MFGEIVRYARPLFNVVEDERFPIPVIIPCASQETAFRRSRKRTSGKT